MEGRNECAVSCRWCNQSALIHCRFSRINSSSIKLSKHTTSSLRVAMACSRLPSGHERTFSLDAESGAAMKSILSLTINPAIDASCTVEAVFPDHKLRSGQVCHEPGGGGINVSRAIQNLGGDSTVFYLAGGPSGEMLGLLLDREGLKHEAILIEDWTRENFVVTERTSGQQ